MESTKKFPFKMGAMLAWSFNMGTFCRHFPFHIGHTYDCTSSKCKGLVTNYGEGGEVQNVRGGGHMKFYPYEKGGHKQF